MEKELKEISCTCKGKGGKESAIMSERDGRRWSVRSVAREGLDLKILKFLFPNNPSKMKKFSLRRWGGGGS